MLLNFYKALTTKPIFGIFWIIFAFNFIICLARIYYLDAAYEQIEIRIFSDFISVLFINVLVFHLLFLIGHKFFKFVVYIFLWLQGALFSANIFTILNFNTAFDVVMIDAVLQTNYSEALEFASVFFTGNVIFLVIFICIICVATYKLSWQMSYMPSMRFFRFIALPYFITIALFCFDIFRLDYHALQRITKYSLTAPLVVLYERLTDYSFEANLKRIAGAYDEHKQTQNLQNFKSRDIQNVILIIGESLQRSYMSVYGYTLDTTPTLKSLQNLGNAVAFSDTVSSATMTYKSLRNILNFSSYESKNEWYESLNIVDMFNLAGFKSFFISNQDMIGINAEPTYSIAVRASENFFAIHDGHNDDTAGEDSVLLPEINKMSQKVAQNKFYVVHLMGNHISYKLRYPSNFAKFKEHELGEPLNEDQKHILAEYLNSILYNDYIIGEIYKFFENENSLIIYLSDHGESLYEYKNSLGHGDSLLSRFVVEIPLIFIASDKFKVTYPEIWRKIELAKNKPFMSDDLIHTVADIIGVKPSEFKSTKSLISDDFDILRKRLIGGETDYDVELKGQERYK